MARDPTKKNNNIPDSNRFSRRQKKYNSSTNTSTGKGAKGINLNIGSKNTI